MNNYLKLLYILSLMLLPTICKGDALSAKSFQIQAATIAIGTVDRGAGYISPSQQQLIPSMINSFYSKLSCTDITVSADPAEFNWFANDFSVLNPMAEGMLNDNGDIGCAVPGNSIRACYTMSFPPGDLTSQASCNDMSSIKTFCIPGQNGNCPGGSIGVDPVQLGPYIARAYSPASGNSICVQILFSTGWQTVSCKNTNKQQSGISTPSPSCLILGSCIDEAQRDSLNFLSLSGAAFNCFKQTLGKVMMEGRICDNKNDPARGNYIPLMQNYMRGTVMAALILYTIIFGMKIAISHQAPQRELVMFIFKMILVLYYSAGIYYNGKYHEGLTPLYNTSLKLIVDFSAFMFSLGGDINNLCYFKTEDYANTTAQYLAVWDSLDCRFYYYLFLSLIANIKAATELLVIGLLGVLLPFLIPVIIIIQFLACLPIIILGLLLGLFALAALSAMIYMLELFMVAFMVVSVLIIFAPIFVPTLLFETTKDTFQKWIKYIIGYTLQPALIAAYIPLMFIIFDYGVFGDCKFDYFTIKKPAILFGKNSSGTTGEGRFYYLTDATWSVDQGGGAGPTQDCKSSWGYLVAPIKMPARSNPPFGEVAKDLTEGLIVPWSVFQSNSSLGQDIKKFYIDVFTTALLAYLMYFFTGMVSGLVAEILDQPDISRATRGANFALNKAVDVTMKAMKLAKKAIDVGLEIAAIFTGGASKAIKETVKLVEKIIKTVIKAIEKAVGAVQKAAATTKKAATKNRPGAEVSASSSKNDKKKEDLGRKEPENNKDK